MLGVSIFGRKNKKAQTPIFIKICNTWRVTLLAVKGVFWKTCGSYRQPATAQCRTGLRQKRHTGTYSYAATAQSKASTKVATVERIDSDSQPSSRIGESRPRLQSPCNFRSSLHIKSHDFFESNCGKQERIMAARRL